MNANTKNEYINYSRTVTVGPCHDTEIYEEIGRSKTLAV